MTLTLDSKIENIAGVGPKMTKKLEVLGLFTVHDIIFNFPRRYYDYSQIDSIAKIPEALRIASQSLFAVRGTLLSIANKKTRRRGFTVTEGLLADDTGTIKVVWFNQPYLGRMLSAGSRMMLFGKVAFDPFSNGYVMEAPLRVSRPEIAAVYSETAGLSSFYLKKLFGKVKPLIAGIKEYLPENILKQNDLPELKEALVDIHEPRSSQSLERARKRFAFEELFIISLRSKITREELQREQAPVISINNKTIENLIGDLPFKLTGDQRNALSEIFHDLSQSHPMSRLLNGDVGSGKTVVAALAAKAVDDAKMKTLFMVPTSILAEQHYETFCKLFGDKTRIGLITAGCQKSNSESGTPLAGRKVMNRGIAKSSNSVFSIHNSQIIIGTHALLNQRFENVGLVIVDEQHRFGVKQRAALQSGVGSREFGAETPNTKHQTPNQKLLPHFLSMTATPIPRTLHLALFGDLDISVIKEKPANRKEIKTRFVEPENRKKAYEFIQKHIENGRQVFVICPIIEDQETDEGTSLFDQERKSVKAEFEKLNSIFPESRIEMLHGKMKSAEKSKIMTDFSKNDIKLLVSTSVVEVGVDIPNATIMIIEDAERFGLAQIHQFRGRVGRGEHQSFCFLFSNSQNERVLSRLKKVESISDGFELAELDLELRGSGAIFGTDQSGLLDLKMASLSDRILIEEATKAAKETAVMIEKFPYLKQKVQEYLKTKHLE